MQSAAGVNNLATKPMAWSLEARPFRISILESTMLPNHTLPCAHAWLGWNTRSEALLACALAWTVQQEMPLVCMLCLLEASPTSIRSTCMPAVAHTLIHSTCTAWHHNVPIYKTSRLSNAPR